LYAVFIEPNMLIVKHQKLYLPYWRQEHNGLKIALLSDFHIGGCINLKKLAKIVNKTNKENPDFIFLLGDIDSYLIRKHKINTAELSEIFSEFKAKYGVISILGNHDYGSVNIKQILLQAGIPVLEESEIIKDINSQPLIIYGLKDFWHYKPNWKKIDESEFKGKSIILLSHNPDLFMQVPDYISLTLSGHTHGGEICLPFFGGIFTPSKWEQRYNKGYIVENNKHLFVTSGLGFFIPLRFGVPPEIVILELYSQDSYPENTIKNTKILTGISHSLNAKAKATCDFLENYFKL
ncbi:MAG: metallophosphoesterase, partial [Candidatus Gastranaerophilales bacterium]|nr:metallophosphoesterase [Candidatus Gastranaerophilales bacterium]